MLMRLNCYEMLKTMKYASMNLRVLKYKLMRKQTQYPGSSYGQFRTVDFRSAISQSRKIYGAWLKKLFRLKSPVNGLMV